MDNFDNIAAVWKTAATPLLPKAGDIISKANKEKKELSNKIWLQGITLLVATAGVLFIATSIHFKFISTYIGLALMVICVSVFSIIRLRQSRFLNKADFSQPVEIILIQFEKFYKKQQWINTKGVALYTIVLNIAFALYFYELLLPESPGFIAIVLALYISWMLFATLWLGKRAVKKEFEKTKAIIDKVNQLKILVKQK